MSQQPRVRIAHLAGPTATIQNTPPLVTSNKARLKHGLAPRGYADGTRARFDVLRAQRLAAPATVYVEQFSAQIPFYAERHRVKPGITGWAQLSYAYGASEEDAKQKLQYDLYYVKNYSLFLDLLILLETAEVVLWGRGAR